jgi:hypothetical protein
MELEYFLLFFGGFVFGAIVGCIFGVYLFLDSKIDRGGLNQLRKETKWK